MTDDDPQLELSPRVTGRASEPARCDGCGRNLLVPTSGLASTEAAASGVWVGVVAYDDDHPHRILRGYARRHGRADVAIACSLDCRATVDEAIAFPDRP